MEKYICYIDESGDEGFSSRSSKTFGFSAIIVKKENDILLPEFQKNILLEISQNKNKPLKHIHFADLKHEQRKFICQKIKDEKLPIRAILVLSDKTTIEHHLKNDFNKEKWKLFNYMARHIIERVSWFIRDDRGTNKDYKIKIIFSNRKQIKMERIQKYIEVLKLDKEAKIEWSTISDKVEVRNHNQIAGLQFADIFATAFRRYAFEGDKYGVETSYIRILKPFLYSYSESKRIEGYGIKIRGLRYENLNKETKELLEYLGFKK